MTGTPHEGPADAQDVVEIRIEGEIGEFARSLFAGFDYVVEPVTTTFSGSADEHQLTELCRRIRDSGLELVSLRRIPPVGGLGPT